MLVADGSSEKDASLGGGSGAEFDECEERSRIGTVGLGGERNDLIGMGSEEFALRAGEVVLRELGDLLEEMRTRFILEEPRGQCLGVSGETSANFGSDRFAYVGSKDGECCFWGV